MRSMSRFQLGFEPRLTCAAALLLSTLTVHAASKDDAHRIATLTADDERLCVIAASGGYTPQLGNAIADELKAQRATRGTHSDASLALLLERLGREQHDAKAVAMAVTTLGTVEDGARPRAPAQALYQRRAAIAPACSDAAHLSH